jgi:hypothetical protein
LGIGRDRGVEVGGCKFELHVEVAGRRERMDDGRGDPDPVSRRIFVRSPMSTSAGVNCPSPLVVCSTAEGPHMTRSVGVVIVAFTAGAVGGAVSGAIAWAQGGPPKVLRAQRFELVNEKGEARAVLDLSKPVRGNVTPGLVLIDRKGKPRAGFTLGDDDIPALVLFDKNGTERLQVMLRADGRPELNLADAKGKWLRLALVDTPQLGLGLVDGKRRALIAPDAVFFSQGDDPNRGSLELGLGPEGRPSLVLNDENGRIRLAAMLLADGPVLSLMDSSGKIVWGAPPSQR